MANNNHLFSIPCYNGTMLKQDYYNNFFEIGQQKINFTSISLLAKIKKVCYNKWGILPYTKAEVIYDSDMSEK